MITTRDMMERKRLAVAIMMKGKIVQIPAGMALDSAKMGPNLLEY
jgi:hypothetical protein